MTKARGAVVRTLRAIRKSYATSVALSMHFCYIFQLFMRPLATNSSVYASLHAQRISFRSDQGLHPTMSLSFWNASWCAARCRPRPRRAEGTVDYAQAKADADAGKGW